jgi:hypothetical protein
MNSLACEQGTGTDLQLTHASDEIGHLEILIATSVVVRRSEFSTDNVPGAGPIIVA